MSQKGFSLLFALLLSTIALIFCSFVYLTTQTDNIIDFFTRPADAKSAYERKNLEHLKASPGSKEISPISMMGTSISNPASEYCIKVGGNLTSEIRGDGGEYNICIFLNNKSCEEWALYNRNCPIGGVKVADLGTKDQIYCVQSGGKIKSGGSDTKCTLPNGHACPSVNFYNGKCQ